MLKRYASIIISFVLVVSIFSFKYNLSANAVSVSAQSAILLCVNNGCVIFEKNSDSKLPMASTTKIMTALLGIEAAAGNNKTIEFTKDMVAEGSSIYLKLGDKIKISELVKGLLAASGNDAANAIANAVSGSRENFLNQMNKRAEQLGMINTHFATPSGLDNDKHFSTARDMAILMEYAMENSEFSKIVSQKSVQVCFDKPQNQINTYENHNRLLSLYEYCVGGKTGFTKKAGRCLVSCAKKDGITLIAVTLNAPDDWNDHINLYNYGFDNLEKKEFDDRNLKMKIKVVGGENESQAITAKSNISLVINKENSSKIKKTFFMPRFVYAPLVAGAQVGRIEYSIDGEIIGKVPLVITNELKYKHREKNIKSLFEDIIDWLNVFD